MGALLLHRIAKLITYSSMKKFFYLIFVLFSTSPLILAQTVLCPENKEVDDLLDKAITAGRAGDSKTAIADLQKGIALSQSTGCLKGEVANNKTLMVLYSHIGEYEKSLEIAKEAEKLSLELKDYKILFTVYSTKATLYDYLGLYNESIKQYELALKYADMIEDPDRKHYERGFIFYNLAATYQDISLEKSGEYLEKAINEIEKVKDNSVEVTLDKKKDMLVSINMNLGIFYKNSENPQRNIQLAESYFTEALKDAENESYTIRNDTKIDLFDALMGLYNVKEEHDKAILYGEKMLELERAYSMPYNRRSAYMLLAKSYLATGNNETSQKYLKLYTKLNDSIFLAERKAVEKPINEIISKNEKSYSEKLRITVLAAGILILIFIVAGLVFWNKRRKVLHKRYEALINDLKTGVSEPVSIEPDTEDFETTENYEVKSTITIPDETVKTLLRKLEKFEKSKLYLQQDISKVWLANHINTNTKYLSDIIKTYRNKSFTNYINGLKINYVLNKLVTDPLYRQYKITYLAEECGYASRQVFLSAFKKETGFTPSYFIENLKKDGLNQELDTE